MFPLSFYSSDIYYICELKHLNNIKTGWVIKMGIRKLQDNEVKTIYNLAHTTDMSYSDIGYLFDVSVNTIIKILDGEIYRDITKHMNISESKYLDMDLSTHSMTKKCKKNDVANYYRMTKEPISRIAKKFNITFKTCKKILLEHDLIEKNIKENKSAKVMELKLNKYMEIADLYNNQNTPVTRIAKNYDVSSHTIYNILEYAMERGVKINRRNG